MKKSLFSSIKASGAIADLIAVICFTSIVLLFLFYRVFQNPFYYFAADISELYLPWWVYLNESLRSGQFPVLNPFWFGGSQPFAAIETGAFYAPFLLAQMFFRASENLDIAYFFYLAMHLGHYLLAAVTFYLFARFGLKLHRFAALFGGIVFATSGAFIGRFVHPVMIFALAWLPLLYLFFIRFVEKRKPIDALLGAATLSLIVVAGHPQIVYYIIIFLLGAIAYFTVVTPSRTRWVLLLGSLAFLLVGIALVAFKILMTAELSGQLIRVAPESMMVTLYDSLHPLYYLTLLVPYIFGRHQIGYWGSDYPWGNWEHFLYIGILPLLFIPFSLAWKQRRLLLFFYGNVALTIFLLLGKYFFLSAVLVPKIPFADSLALVSRFADLFHFFLVSIATIGIHVAMNLKTYRQKLAIAIPTFLILGLILLRLTPRIATLLGYQDRPLPSPEAFRFIAANISQSRVLFLLSAVGTLLFFTFRQPKFRYLLISIFALDIFLSASDFNPIEASPGSPNQYFKTTTVTSLMKQDPGIFRVENLWPRNINMIAGIETTYGYRTSETIPYRTFMSLSPVDHPPMLDLLNVKYVVSEKEVATNPHLIPILPSLWQNTTAMDRVSFIPAGRVVSNEQGVIQYLLSPSFNPRQEVLLEEPNVIQQSTLQSLSDSQKANVNIARYTASELTATVTAPQSGYLLFSQFRYPGWTAQIDGVSTKLLAANLSMYAVAIPGGTHNVRFKYRSKPLEIGGPIAGMTVLGIVGSLFHPAIRKRYFTSLSS